MNTCIDVAVLKPNGLVYYKDFEKKNFNEKSKNNLIQNQKKEKTKSQSIKEKQNITDVNTWAKAYISANKAETQNYFTGGFSKNTVAKIKKITSVFVQSIIKGYRPQYGFKQRIITFSTLTLTEPQKHNDKTVIKTFVDFIDHLKKVSQKLINNLGNAPELRNYVWRAETQENGNIHFHIIADTFINKNTLQKLWNVYLMKLGYKPSPNSARVESLKRGNDGKLITNVEGYLTKYMSKPPLKNEYKNLSQQKALAILKATEGKVNPFRRPVIGKSWGCSRAVLKLSYPKFFESEVYRLYEIQSKLKEVKSENLPDFIRYYRGNTKKQLRRCSYELQRKVKNHYLLCYDHLNREEVTELTQAKFLRLERFCRENKISLVGELTDSETLDIYNEISSKFFNYELWKVSQN